MLHISRALCRAQCKVIILTAVMSRPQPTQFFKYCPSNSNDVAEIHMGQKQERRPSRLERGRNPLPFQIELVAVCIDEIELRLASKCENYFRKAVFGNYIILINKYDYFTRRSLEANICCLANSNIYF